jgi:hypothetical protein
MEDFSEIKELSEAGKTEKANSLHKFSSNKLQNSSPNAFIKTANNRIGNLL